MNIQEIQANIKALEQLLETLPTLIKQSLKLEYVIDQNIIALKLYELENYINHAIRISEEQIEELQQLKNKKC